MIIGKRAPVMSCRARPKRLPAAIAGKSRSAPSARHSKGSYHRVIGAAPSLLGVAERRVNISDGKQRAAQRELFGAPSVAEEP